MSSLPAAIEFARREIAAGQPWVWAVTIESSTQGESYRVCTGARHVSLGGVKFQAAVARVDVPEQGSDPAEGALVVPWHPTVMQALDAEDERVGHAVTIELWHLGETPTRAHGWSQTLLRAPVEADAVTLATGNPAEIELVPSRVFTRDAFPGMLSGQGAGVNR